MVLVNIQMEVIILGLFLMARPVREGVKGLATKKIPFFVASVSANCANPSVAGVVASLLDE